MIALPTKQTRAWLLILILAAVVDAAETDGAAGHWLRVTTDWEPDVVLASAAAEVKLRAAIVSWLAAARPSSTRNLTTENLARLLSFPAVCRTDTMEQKDRAYGTVYRSHAAIQIPPAVLDAWQAELHAVARRRLLLRWTKCGVTVLALIAWLVVTCRLDSWTHAYRRRPIAIFSAATLATLLAAIWGL